MERKFGLAVLRDWGWSFSIESSADGQKYLASVYTTRIPFTSGGMKVLRCMPVFFSKQTGAIYEGKPIGCH